MDVIKEVCVTIAEELELPPERVTAESDSSNLEKWDSLGQLQIIMALESKFKIKFRTLEISELRSVRKLSQRIEELYDHR